MEVVNLENENKLVNTKVFVIDRNGNIYKNGDIFSNIRHKVLLLEIANVLYPGNEIAKTLDEGDVSPYNTALIFNLLGYAVLLNSPTRKDSSSSKTPSYLMVFENHEVTEVQRQSIEYCLAHFDDYCVEFCAKNLLKMEQNMQVVWDTITPTGIPEIKPLEAYLEHLKEQEKIRKLTK